MIEDLIKKINRILNFKSVSARISFTLGLNISILLILVLASTLYFQNLYAKRQAFANLRTYADTVIEFMEKFMETGQNEALTSAIQDIKSKSDKNVSIDIIHSDSLKKNLSTIRYLPPRDEVEEQVLSQGQFQSREVSSASGRMIQYVLPVKAKASCLTCHNVKKDQVLAAVTVGYSLKDFDSHRRKFAIFAVSLSLLGGIIVTALIVLVLKITTTKPLMLVSQTLEKIGEGSLSHSEIEIDQNDEIGKQATTFNKMLRGLCDLVTRAEMISNGVLGADEVEKKLASGMDLETASAAGNHQQGDLAEAFNRMQTELRKLTIQARAIAKDELNNSVLKNRIPGELGDAFAQMVSNLKEIAEDAEKIAEGDLTISIESRSDQEVLTKAFGRMVTNLRNLIQRINQSALSLSNSSSELARVSEQVAQSSTQLSGVITQITQSTSSVAQSAQAASSSAQSASESVRKGQELAQEQLTRMQTMQVSVSQTREAMANLNRYSARIGEILTVITKIAEQTNLLSLNAAIEAARAGDSGRGFAVVADEIRKLAEHSAGSAQEISKLITEIQSETEVSVKAAERSAQEVEEAGKMMIKTKEGLQVILASTEQEARQIEQIAAAAQELAASTEEVSSTSEEQAAAAEEVSASAENINQTAEELKKFVVKFQLGDHGGKS